MRRLINYLRQAFCAHQWEQDESGVGFKQPTHGSMSQNPRISATCTKCGYHHSYWKF